MDVANADDSELFEETNAEKRIMTDLPDKRKLDDSCSSDMEIVDESDCENTDVVSEELMKNHSSSSCNGKQEEQLENGTSKAYPNTKNVKVHPKSESDLSEKNANGKLVENLDEDTAADERIEEMVTRTENLESELRQVAALEVALYSVVPDHGTSAYKVHAPARHLSRLYIHACEKWPPEKQASVARNTVSGLILVSKSCGNDVSRLTFWLSNAVVFREIISQAIENSSPLPYPVNPKGNGNGNVQSADDWEEKWTLTAALEKVESWIFYRVVESIWWQTLTPNMQAPPIGERSAVGDQKQGNFSIDSWKSAFHDALKRLCPLRAGGHECGCLPVIVKKVLEQCIGRLDVAMFNAILRESAHEMPTDPVSDPIVDSRVLPIPAGDLSFGSGAQLKYAVGSWSRWLSDAVLGSEETETDHGEKETKERKSFFRLLNELSDLLMLPKDLILDSKIRMEVCPSISVALVKRILCNFSPDEFSPDHVPGAVLEALNYECHNENNGINDISFPYSASPVVYTAPPPSSLDGVYERVTEANNASSTPRLSKTPSRKGKDGGTAIDELESCVASVVGLRSSCDENARYALLRDIWNCCST